MKKKNSHVRRTSALARLRSAKFFEKKDRTEDQWQQRKEREISVLEKRTNAL